MAEVLLQRVSKVFAGGAVAVDCVDLAIPSGEFVVLVGPSGCGKSTTLRIIAGLETATAGAVSIASRVVNEVPPKDRDVAFVFQNYALYPHMTVRGNMAFPLEQRRMVRGIRSLFTAARRAEQASIEARVAAVAHSLGIEDLLERKPAQLSGGQRQRVAVGRAMVRNPKVFLFDEPLSNLDAKLRGEMRTELRILHKRLQSTMVYVTHDQEEAMSLADRIVVMHHGQVQQIGSPLEVYSRPLNKFVAGFIGTPTMNFMQGKVEVTGSGHTFSLELTGSGSSLSSGAGSLPLPSGRWRDLRAACGRSLVLGIRPDRVRLAPIGSMPAGAAASSPSSAINGGSGGSASIAGSIVAVEHYGDRMDVVADTACGRLTARCAPTEAQEGSPCLLLVDMTAAHLFEVGEAGQSVSLS